MERPTANNIAGWRRNAATAAAARARRGPSRRAPAPARTRRLNSYRINMPNNSLPGLPFTEQDVKNFWKTQNSNSANAVALRARLHRNLGLPPTPNQPRLPAQWRQSTTQPIVRQIMSHPLFGQYLEAYISQLRTPQPELSPSVVVIPPQNMPFTAADLAKFWKTENLRTQNARNFRRNLSVRLGLPPGSNSVDIETHPNFQRYYRKYQNLKVRGGLKFKNLRGATRWVPPRGRREVIEAPFGLQAGGVYSRFSGPVIEALHTRLHNIPRAIIATIPGIRRRAGLIATGLARPVVNNQGPWRPALPAMVARRITNLLKKLEIEQARANAPGAAAAVRNARIGENRGRIMRIGIPLGPPRFPALLPPPPAANEAGPSNAGLRRSARRR